MQLTPYWDSVCCWEILLLLSLFFCLLYPVASDVIIDKMPSCHWTFRVRRHVLIPFSESHQQPSSSFSSWSILTLLMPAHCWALNSPGKIMMSHWEAQRAVVTMARGQPYPKVKETIVRTRVSGSSGLSVMVVQTATWVLEVGPVGLVFLQVCGLRLVMEPPYASV